jgi:hypothetical protein
MSEKVRKEHKIKIFKQDLHQLPSPYSPTCAIATIAYGSSTYFKLNYFREFRDKFLGRTKFGSKLIKLYYRASPSVAKFIENKNSLKLILRYALIEPFYFFFKFILTLFK